MEMTSSNIKTRFENGILEITFSRPEKKNSLTKAMYLDAASALDRARSDRSIRVVMFSSEGSTFTAGNDLSDFLNDDHDDANDSAAQTFIKAIAAADKPIIAAVNGAAVGVGMTMLLHCDLLYITENASLCAPFVGLGLVPEAASSLLLPMHIGHVRAFSVFALGEKIAGKEAVSLGLANKVVDADMLRDTAYSAALQLAKMPTSALVTTKKLMRNKFQTLQRAEQESFIFNAHLKTGEAKEAFTAFSERRAPDFSKFL